MRPDNSSSFWTPRAPVKSYNLNSLVFSIPNYDVVASQFDNLHSLVSLRKFDWRLTPLVDVVCQITPRVMKTFYSLSAAGRVLYNQETCFVLVMMFIFCQPWKGSPWQGFQVQSGNCAKIDMAMSSSSAMTNLSLDPWLFKWIRWLEENGAKGVPLLMLNETLISLRRDIAKEDEEIKQML